MTEKCISNLPPRTFRRFAAPGYREESGPRACGAASQAASEATEVSELQAVRHYTRLSRLNFSIDTHFYPLGSCTMKYNPRACNTLAMLPEFLARHPLAPVSQPSYSRACMSLQEILKEVTGMARPGSP